MLICYLLLRNGASVMAKGTERRGTLQRYAAVGRMGNSNTLYGSVLP